jgi:phage regulator Rha-like protein
MKTDIVHVKKNDILTTSKLVAEMLEVPHNVLQNTIEKLIERQKNNSTAKLLKFPQKFIKSSFTNKMGRTYSMYEMNEQAYMKLAMHLKGYDKAEQVQDSIIEAFSLMKQALLNHQNTSWLNARDQGKQIRALETDIIKDFVEYATGQGSKNAKFYYSNITKMTNKALELLVQVKDGKPLRELATITELGYIQMADNLAMQVISTGMNEQLPYKFIYKQAKSKVNEFVDFMNIKSIT